MQKSVIVLANKNAGTVLELGEERFNEMVAALFEEQGETVFIELASAEDLIAAFQRAAVREDIGVILLAGGDGTVNAVLPSLARLKVRTGILALGTLNLIGRDLGATGVLARDVSLILRGQSRDVDLARVNGIPFHSNAGLGWFVTIAKERQSARRRFPFSKTLGFLRATFQTLVFSRSFDVECTTEDGIFSVKADAVLVTNNRFSGSPWRRTRLDEGVFELHVVKAPSILTRLTTLMAVKRGTWRDLGNVRSVAATKAVINRKGRTVGHVSLDGELRRVSFPLHFETWPAAVSLIKMPSEPGSSVDHRQE